MSYTHKKRFNTITTSNGGGKNIGNDAANSTFTAVNVTSTVSRKSSQY